MSTKAKIYLAMISCSSEKLLTANATIALQLTKYPCPTGVQLVLLCWNFIFCMLQWWNHRVEGMASSLFSIRYLNFHVCSQIKYIEWSQANAIVLLSLAAKQDESGKMKWLISNRCLFDRLHSGRPLSTPVKCFTAQVNVILSRCLYSAPSADSPVLTLSVKAFPCLSSS